MPVKYDAIVIGTGQSGPSLAVRLAGTGLRVAVIERKRFGGTCVNTGCTPTKAMVASARAAYVSRRAGDYGVSIDGTISIDMRRVKARRDEIVQQSAQGVEKRLRSTKGCTVYQGHARFTGPHSVEVGGELLHAEKIFIDVGTRAFIPSIAGLEPGAYLTNSSIMELDSLPRHLIIIGGGYVGLEFGQMFRRFGSEVSILEKGPRLIGRDDEDISDAVRQILEAEGIRVLVEANCMKVEKRANGIAVTLECKENVEEIAGSHLLVAVGRQPNTDDLGLQAAGIQTDDRGYIQVDDQLQTNVPSVWALGDCNGKGAFTHTSYNDYEIVAANLLDGEKRRVSDRFLAYAVYIDPPLGRVGMTEAEVRKSGRKGLMATRPMTRVARAVEKGETLGFMKVLADAETRQILGAAILGTGGDEAVHSILSVMYARATYDVLQRSVPVLPTVSALIPTLLGDLKPLEAK